MNISKNFRKAIFFAGAIILAAGFSAPVKNDEKMILPAGVLSVYQNAPETGVGPFKSVDLGKSINMELAGKGKELYEGRCTACHKFDERFVGPPLGNITKRRNPVWIMNMIINPGEMVQKDPIAKELLAEYMTPMVNMGVNEEDTRAILEYLRARDEGKIK